MSRPVYAACGAALSLICAIGSAQAQTVVVTKDSPIEATLAMIDSNSPIVSQALISRYATFLDTLERRCTEGRTMISDMAVRSTQLIEEESGKKVMVRTMLEQTVNATEGQKKQSCAGIMAAVAVLMGKT